MTTAERLDKWRELQKNPPEKVGLHFASVAERQGCVVDMRWEDWSGKAVRCQRHLGFERSFEVGVEYMCVKDYSTEGYIRTSFILVLDIENNEIKVPKIYFYRGAYDEPGRIHSEIT